MENIKIINEDFQAESETDLNSKNNNSFFDDDEVTFS